MVPLLPPLHVTLVLVVEALTADAGWVIVAVVLVVQPLLSVTVTLYVPGLRLVRFCVVTPPVQL